MSTSKVTIEKYVSKKTNTLDTEYPFIRKFGSNQFMS